jgi:hypothetical protein
LHFSSSAVKTVLNRTDKVKCIGQCAVPLTASELIHMSNLHVEKMKRMWVEDLNSLIGTKEGKECLFL